MTHTVVLYSTMQTICWMWDCINKSVSLCQQCTGMFSTTSCKQHTDSGSLMCWFVLPQQVTLDLLQYENIAVRRVLRTEEALVAKLGVTDFPSCYLYYPSGNFTRLHVWVAVWIPSQYMTEVQITLAIFSLDTNVPTRQVFFFFFNFHGSTRNNLVAKRFISVVLSTAMIGCLLTSGLLMGSWN